MQSNGTKKQLIEGLVSVIIPTYNREQYICEAILSVLNQTYKKIEIIVVDDASSDQTKERLEKFQNNKNFVYIRQNQNRGVAISRNKGMDVAQGQYVAFLDSDDIWDKQKIEKQIQAMIDRKSFFAYTGLEIINEKGEIIRPFRSIEQKVNFDFLLRKTIIATSSVVIDIKEVGKIYMPELNCCEDYISWLNILKRGYEAIGVNEPLLMYRKTGGSLSANKVKNVMNVWKAQVNYLGIKPIKAYFNCGCYAFYGLKKHFF